jgi:hypothetical protein
MSNNIMTFYSVVKYGMPSRRKKERLSQENTLLRRHYQNAQYLRRCKSFHWETGCKLAFTGHNQFYQQHYDFL